MGETTGIEWTDRSWNPWTGCVKISPGCKFCYMYADKERYGQDPFVVVRSKTTFEAPMRWNEPARVFTCSWSDFFIEQADPWRDEAWEIIRRTPHLTYQILTKRPERMAAHLPSDWSNGYRHVWLGVSVEDQSHADERIPLLRETPAALRFLSIEPQIAPVDISPWLGADIVDWVICGGESGPNARPFKIEWAESLIEQCRAAGVPFFMKQVGAKPREQLITMNGELVKGMYRLLIAKDRKGGNPNTWPKHLRVREFPS